MAYTYNAETNPNLGPPGTACMHGDAQSSDCTPLPGPGTGSWDVRHIDLKGACPTVVVGSDGFIQVLVTQRIGSNLSFLQPKLVILDPNTVEILSELEIPKGSLLGGIYAYLDNQNRLTIVDGNLTLLRITHGPDGRNVNVDLRMQLKSVLAGDSAISQVPAWDGKLWIVTVNARVLLVDLEARSVLVTSLHHFSPDERVDNSVSASPAGCAVTTTHGLYMVEDVDGRPEVKWSAAYDRGVARKPGKLTFGSGASPTFFGPTGSNYLTITDNAHHQENLLVYDAKTGRELGRTGVSRPGASGTECSAIGLGKSIVVASTYGYPYPRVPDHAGSSKPLLASMAPGLERWDLDDQGLRNVWRQDESFNAVVPRLSTADGIIYMCERPHGGSKVKAVARSMDSGEVLHEQTLPGLVTLFGVDTLQMVGTIDSNRVWWQGTIGGIFRIAPGEVARAEHFTS